MCPIEMARHEQKAIMANLRQKYFLLAKERHPDLAKPEHKATAAEGFVQLHTEFHEAIELLEQGVRPVFQSVYSSHSTSPKHAPGYYGWQPQDPHMYSYQAHAWNPHAAGFQHTQEPVFDLKTRVKGHVLLWSSLFIFFTLLREFLVGTAGSTWAWSPPANWNPFWLRRFQNEWAEEAKHHSETKSVKPQEPVKPWAPSTNQALVKKKSTPNFYQKRVVTPGVRRKSEKRPEPQPEAASERS